MIANVAGGMLLSISPERDIFKVERDCKNTESPETVTNECLFDSRYSFLRIIIGTFWIVDSRGARNGSNFEKS
jgi:hypothetical protein